MGSLVVAATGLRRLAAAFPRVTVEGRSMEPSLLPGDRLLLVPARGLRPGQVVAAPDPRQPERLLVKRVVWVDTGRRLVWVEGDNLPHSTDSRAFGPLRRRAIVGRALYRYAPASRAGPVGVGR
jgi:nickel-type superoxide dismutase maturation protease